MSVHKREEVKYTYKIGDAVNILTTLAHDLKRYPAGIIVEIKGNHIRVKFPDKFTSTFEPEEIKMLTKLEKIMK